MPRGVAKAKAKGKAKGKGKGKAKAKGGKAKARALVKAPRDEEVLDGEEPKPKEKKPKKPAGVAGKVLADLEGMPVAEAIAQARNKLVEQDAIAQQAAAHEKQCEQVSEGAGKKLEIASKRVEETTAKESAALEDYRASLRKRKDAEQDIYSAKERLADAQRKVTILETMAANQAKKDEVLAQKDAVKEKKEMLKRSIVEQKQREKEALLATRLALKNIRAEQLAGKRRGLLAGAEAAAQEKRQRGPDATEVEAPAGEAAAAVTAEAPASEAAAAAPVEAAEAPADEAEASADEAEASADEAVAAPDDAEEEVLEETMVDPED